MDRDVLKGLARPQGRRLRLAWPRGRGLRLARPQGCVFRLARHQGRGFRLTQSRGLHLARPQGHGFCLARPQGRGFRLAQGHGLCLAWPRGRGFCLIRWVLIPSPTTPSPSVWAWVKTLMSGKTLARLDIIHGHDGPYLRTHISNNVGWTDVVLSNPRTNTDGVERYGR